MPLFEVALLSVPTKKGLEEGESEKLLLKPTAVVAREAQTAAIQVVMAEQDALKGVDMTKVQVIVRPFGN